MAQQSSIIKLVGKVDGISFYRRQGMYIARKASGPSRAKIMSDPNYESTRKNLKEFSGVGRATGAFNKCFHSVKMIRDGIFCTRVSKILRTVMHCSKEPLGQRSIRLSQHRLMLTGLQLNSATNLSSVFSANITAYHADDRNSASITTGTFKPARAIKRPASASHFQIVQLITIAADTIFDPHTNEYKLSNETLNGKHQITHSDYYALDSKDEISITLTSTLPDIPALEDNVTVIHCVGILFYDRIGTTYYPMHTTKAMKVIEAF